MNESEAVEKNMTVGSGKNAYKAVSEAAMLNLIKPLFKKHKLIIFPIDGAIQDHVMVWDKTNYDGKAEKSLRAMTELKVMYRILDTETKEFQDVVGFGNGSDPQDKGAGKAFTYSLKNALSKSFMLFSGEDTDNEHSDDIGRKPQNPPQDNKPVGNDNHQPDTQQGSKNDSSDLISDAQAKRLYAIAKGNIDLIKKVLKSHNYVESKLVKKSDYQKICEEIEHPIKESKIDICADCKKPITECECELPF